jgi:hypothetical protein
MTSSDEKTNDGQRSKTFVDRESALEAGLPTQEKQQPDPMLQITTGHIGAGGVTLVAIAVAVILGFVLYGLNFGGTAQHTATAPPPPNNMLPAGGGQSGPPNTSGVKG